MKSMGKRDLIFLLSFVLIFTISLNVLGFDIPDGSFTGSGEGLHGNIKVEVDVKDGEIVAIKVVEHNENPNIAQTAIKKVTENILKEQDYDVDSVTGATYTSEGIKEAVKNALANKNTIKKGKWKPGTYVGAGEGMHGPIEVMVEVSSNSIEKIIVLEDNETPNISDTAFERIPAEIIENQEINVETVTGATYTSEGLIKAVEDALSSAVIN